MFIFFQVPWLFNSCLYKKSKAWNITAFPLKTKPNVFNISYLFYLFGCKSVFFLPWSLLVSSEQWKSKRKKKSDKLVKYLKYRERNRQSWNKEKRKLEDITRFQVIINMILYDKLKFLLSKDYILYTHTHVVCVCVFLWISLAITFHYSYFCILVRMWQMFPYSASCLN